MLHAYTDKETASFLISIQDRYYFLTAIENYDYFAIQIMRNLTTRYGWQAGKDTLR